MKGLMMLLTYYENKILKYSTNEKTQTWAEKLSAPLSLALRGMHKPSVGLITTESL